MRLERQTYPATIVAPLRSEIDLIERDRGDRCDRLFASVFLWGGGGELKGENWDGNWG